MTYDEDIAWAAGIFEGEGCVYVNPDGKNGGCLVVTMTDLDVIERFTSILGVGYIYGPLPVAKPEHKPGWTWRAGRWEDIVMVRDAFEPWLGERRMAKFAELKPIGPKGRIGQTHCKRGHPFFGPDADCYERPDPKTGYMRHVCRPCHRYWTLLSKEKKRQQEKAA